MTRAGKAGCKLHPVDQREKLTGDLQGRVRCLVCGTVFTPKAAKYRHGTYRGYGRHRRQHSGNWPWPPLPECGCSQAGTAYRSQASKTPENARKRKDRGMARQRALSRLRQMYPYLYAEVYARELAQIEAGAEMHPRVPFWDDVMRRLVKEALGKDEATVYGQIQARTATAHEREFMRLAGIVRGMLAGKP